MAVWECSISHHSHGAAPAPGGDAGGLAGSPLSHAISSPSSGFCGQWSVVPATPQPLSHPHLIIPPQTSLLWWLHPIQVLGVFLGLARESFLMFLKVSPWAGRVLMVIRMVAAVYRVSFVCGTSAQGQTQQV